MDISSIIIVRENTFLRHTVEMLINKNKNKKQNKQINKNKQTDKQTKITIEIRHIFSPGFF